ncbi:hypothetical protein HPP92_002501 [Vanilla planifolia]|uniref:Uncharacterized protein n=1 Tax=Vanilla planifolia TaxID=51239 RepID=A0A835S1P0_VANPL|nr:hypothetical protein HPP92_002501 [Vanilla planifolia]
MRRMRERSSSAKKHGEVSWPKIIFRKWLNLNNKESDFSADERDNNTDFDEEVEEEEDNVRAIPLLCVGTWNVGGKVPNHDLDIEEWLDTEDPADIYVLGHHRGIVAAPETDSESDDDRVHPLDELHGKTDETKYDLNSCTTSFDARMQQKLNVEKRLARRRLDRCGGFSLIDCDAIPKTPTFLQRRCDRVLTCGKGIKILSYRRNELNLSDHRPVTATFSAEVEVFSHRKLQRALTLTDAEVDDGKIVADMAISVDMDRLRLREEISESGS